MFIELTISALNRLLNSDSRLYLKASKCEMLFQMDLSFNLRDFLSVNGTRLEGSSAKDYREQLNGVGRKGKLINIDLENSDLNKAKQFPILKEFIS